MICREGGTLEHLLPCGEGGFWIATREREGLSLRAEQTISGITHGVAPARD